MDGVALWHLDVGVNWYIQQNEAKLQLDFLHVSEQSEPDDNSVILAAQAYF